VQLEKFTDHSKTQYDSLRNKFTEISRIPNYGDWQSASNNSKYIQKWRITYTFPSRHFAWDISPTGYSITDSSTNPPSVPPTNEIFNVDVLIIIRAYSIYSELTKNVKHIKHIKMKETETKLVNKVWISVKLSAHSFIHILFVYTLPKARATILTFGRVTPHGGIHCLGALSCLRHSWIGNERWSDDSLIQVHCTCNLVASWFVLEHLGVDL